MRYFKTGRNACRQAIRTVKRSILTLLGVEMTCCPAAATVSKNTPCSFSHKCWNNTIHALMLVWLTQNRCFPGSRRHVWSSSRYNFTILYSRRGNVRSKHCIQLIEPSTAPMRLSMFSKGEVHPHCSVRSFTHQPSFRKARRWVQKTKLAKFTNW